MGEFFSEGAQALGAGLGEQVVLFAQNAEFFGLKNLGEGIQNLQAGEAPAFPEACNSD